MRLATLPSRKLQALGEVAIGRNNEQGRDCRSLTEDFKSAIRNPQSAIIRSN
ncbi:MAG: hypothetical protein QME81_08900 [bacterium]|nr:hypothetical protein [bacterium]